jgi:hypothetical protein
MTDATIVGICRFSYLSTRGWKRTERDDPDATAGGLYDDARMRERFDLFEAICLPSVLAQKDKDFIFLIVASFAMPEKWRDRLDALAAPHDNIQVAYLRPRPMTEAVTVALRRTLGRRNPDPVVQFCLDDDDAVSVNYVARLRREADTVLNSPFADRLPVAINHPRGISLSKQKGQFEAHENYAPFLALGLALITDGSIPTNIYICPHLKTPTRIFSIVDPKPITYLRGLHDHHDSFGISKGRVRSLKPERLSQILKREFPFVTEEVLARVFDADTGADGALATIPQLEDHRAPGAKPAVLESVAISSPRVPGPDPSRPTKERPGSSSPRKSD